MRGRKWTEGPVGIKITVFARNLEKSLNDYIGGIMDTLDGSHGPSFAYLLIVFQDDCQVCNSHAQFLIAKKPRYVVEVEFLGNQEGREAEGKLS